MSKSGFKLPAKEFKEILKSVLSFSDSLGGTFGSAATFTLDPPAIRLTSELATLEVLIPAQDVMAEGPKHFHFHMEPLAKLAFTGAAVDFSWSDLTTLNVRCGSFKADMRVAAATHASVAWPETKALVTLPYDVVPEICKYLRLPNSYVDLGNGNTAIELSCDGSSFVAACEDSFSFIRYSVPLTEVFGPLVLPYYVLLAVNSKHIKSGTIAVGSNGNSCIISTPKHTLCSSSLNDKLNPWDVAMSSMGRPVMSATVGIDDLMDAVKPLFAMIPVKEKSSAIISMTPEEGGLKFDLSQSGSSSAASVVPCQVIGGGTINLHPQAFYDFISMLSGLTEPIELSAAPMATKMTAKTKVGVLEYLITNVIL